MPRKRAVEQAVAERGPIVAKAIRDWHLEGASHERIAKELWAIYRVDVSSRAVGVYVDGHQSEWFEDEVVVP